MVNIIDMHNVIDHNCYMNAQKNTEFFLPSFGDSTSFKLKKLCLRLLLRSASKKKFCSTKKP